MRMFFKKSLLFLSAVLLFVVVQSQDKRPGIISGNVKDARTKTPLTEAVITLSSNSFEGQKFVVTDSTGMYKVNNLPAGTYKIAFEMEGYEKFVKDNIDLKEGMSLGINYLMVKEGKRNKEKRSGSDSLFIVVKHQ